MRITHLFAVLLAVTGTAVVTPAMAATSTTRIATTLSVDSGVPNASADQYRSRRYDRRGYRGRGYGYRGYGYRYRPRYYGGGPRWRSGRLACRTSWRYGRARRVCWRRW